ncbi:acetyltransferase [Bacillus sp. CH30_1T]|uniref:acetyltransferase n=1 Tax=Bacillus sp. CH30_1T TaxID=2604836 RepID=UPI0011ECBCCA|nr:acetyltransferase [Bacillus sp. CH30_1T]KAA0565840.1 acetyltransferase [Bacillus sp. CH30_1T]
MKNKLMIIGASGHGKVVADIALKMNKWSNIVFLDDDQNVDSSMGIEVIGTTDDVITYKNEYEIVVGIGNNYIREKIQNKLEATGAKIPTLIHPSAIIGEQVYIGSGTVVMAGVVINCCTRVGKGCIINTATSIDHDNIIGDYVHISPGCHLAGTVTVENLNWIGIGSKVSNNVMITNGCVIGAGATVINNITEVGTYVGVPIRKIK